MRQLIRTLLLAIITLLNTSLVMYGQKKPGKKVNTDLKNAAWVNEITGFVRADSSRLTELFKDIHSSPELGFMEIRTGGIVAKELRSLGFEVKEGIGTTGIAGILQNGDGPIVMYRADMDCNAVKEVTGLPYASTKTVKLQNGTEVPVMHACGHDAHVVWMLGVAKFMAEKKQLWKGTLIMVGQPAEEPVTGAEAMVKDGLYTKYGVPEPDYLFGMHTAPIPIGIIGAAAGIRQAGTDQIDVIFHGIGGHGSTPHTTRDPVIMAASAIMQYQAIVSRAINPQNAAVVTVGSVQAGSDNNVIPSSSLVKINLRWFNENDRKILLSGITGINEGIARAYNLPKELYPEMIMKGGAKPLNNDTALTKVVQKSITQIVNPDYVLKEDVFPAIMGSEDFHHLVIHNTKKVAYCYINIGVADPVVFEAGRKAGKDMPYNAHNGDFVVDLKAIPYGTKVGILSTLSIFNDTHK